jgi:predicted nucleic acid-binding protein
MIKVIFECNGEDLGETELDVLPQNSDIVHLERYDNWKKYVALNRVWVFDKEELPYVKLILVEQK